MNEITFQRNSFTYELFWLVRPWSGPLPVERNEDHHESADRAADANHVQSAMQLNLQDDIKAPFIYAIGSNGITSGSSVFEFHRLQNLISSHASSCQLATAEQ